MLDTLADLRHAGGFAPIKFTAELVRLWLAALQVQTLFIDNPWENGIVQWETAG